MIRIDLVIYSSIALTFAPGRAIRTAGTKYAYAHFILAMYAGSKLSKNVREMFESFCDFIYKAMETVQ